MYDAKVKEVRGQCTQVRTVRWIRGETIFPWKVSCVFKKEEGFEMASEGQVNVWRKARREIPHQV